LRRFVDANTGQQVEPALVDAITGKPIADPRLTLVDPDEIATRDKF